MFWDLSSLRSVGPDLDSATHCERDDIGENCEIQITPEMIDGGVSELVRFDTEFESFEEAVIRIYRRMEMVKRECQILP